MNLTRLNYPLGWTPISDKLGGTPEGLLRMDNLTIDEDGSVTLARGIQDLYSQPAAVEDIFSRSIDGVEQIYASCGQGSTITRNGSNIATGTDHAAFGDGLGHVFICAGTTKKKDKSGVLSDLGIDKPADGPDVSDVNQVTVDITGSWAAEEGHDGTLLGDSYKIYPDATTLRTVIKLTSSSTNTTEMGGDVSNYDINQDTFLWLFQAHDSSTWKRIRLEILLDDADNYYYKEWVYNTDDFNSGINSQTVLTCKRSEFTRHGDDLSLNWTKVIGIRVMGDAIADTYMLAGEFRFLGGPKGVLNGFYKYAFRACVDNGTYIGKSPLSPPSRTVYATNGYVTVTPSAAGATSYEIYRKSVIEQVDTNLQQSHLDKWYLVGESTGAFDDKMSDVEALQLNKFVSDNLLSLKTVPDSILSMEGPDHERMIYMTFRDVLLSERLNPDCIDSKYTIRVSGDTTEKNLWIKVVSNESRILATTKDLYEIGGTLLDLPDGSLDISIRKIGEGFPPLGPNVAAVDGGLYYVAKDGLRVTNGSNSIPVSPHLYELFAGKECNGVPPILIAPGVLYIYPVAIGKSRIYTSLPLTDGTRRLFVFNLNTKQWRILLTDPIALASTPDGRVIAGYGGGSGNSIRTIDDGVGINGNGMAIFFQTVYDANGQPRNRKDTFTLKIVANTGGQDVSVLVGKDGGDFSSVGTLNSNGISTSYFRMDGFALGFRYAIRLVSTANGLTIFKLNEQTIEYDPRPEQVNYLRIASTNLGTLARKRFVSFAFVIDTLGHSITLTPFVDGTSKATTTFIKVGKLTYIHFFLENTEGVDIGAVLAGASANDIFEFYGLNLEETVSEKLPTPARYLVIPANDYGSPNRKRHTSYKFQINTRGANVRFTPKVDGVTYAPATFNTTEKRTVEYFFDTSIDVVGIDIGGVLESLTALEFEFYGVIVPQQVEILPPRLKSLYTPFTNFGTADRKRVRTIPLVINTGGEDVTYTPIVDSVSLPSSIINTSRKQTVYHYFTTDVFGIDFGGSLIGNHPFEFYGFGSFEKVEILPVPKKYDQFQPQRFDKIGKLFGFRVRLIMTGTATSLAYSINGEGQESYPEYNGTLYSGSFPVRANSDDVYEVQLPKSINATVIRLILGPSDDAFHRYDVQIRYSPSGMETDSRWIQIR